MIHPILKAACLLILLAQLIVKLVLLQCHQNIQSHGLHFEHEGLKSVCLAITLKTSLLPPGKLSLGM